MSDLRPAKRVFSKTDSLFDKFWLELKNPEKYELTPTEQQIKKRWNDVFTMRAAGLGKVHIMHQLCEFHGISESQAYQDIRNSIHFYGDAMQGSSKGDKAILIEMAFDAYRMAKKDRDAAAMNRAIETIAKLSDFDESKNFNPKKFENVEVKLGLSPEVEAAMLTALKTNGVLDFNKVEAEDAEFTEVD